MFCENKKFSGGPYWGGGGIVGKKRDPRIQDPVIFSGKIRKNRKNWGKKKKFGKILFPKKLRKNSKKFGKIL